jgi:glycosyltransferase involved in cell wall biosynthesis
VKISVIVPTYERRHLLERTLETVFVQDFAAADYETIVVVDGSTDGTAAYLRGIRKPSCGFKIIEQPNRGLASARNAGLREARGDLVLFLDDDLICDSRLIRAHYEAHQRPGEWIVSGLILPGREIHGLAGDLHSTVLKKFASVVKDGIAEWPRVACGANDSAPRDMLIRAGGYDERFVGSREELELGIRLWRMGARIRYQPEAVVYHSYEKSPADLVERESVKVARNELLLCRIHPDYRPFSPIAELFHARLLKRLPMQLVARAPFSLEPLLRLPFALADTMQWAPGARRIGIRLLRIRMKIVELRGAVREAGSWGVLRQEFDR